MWEWNIDLVKGRPLSWGVKNSHLVSDSTSPLLLFVHGAGSRGRYWKKVVDYLPEHFCSLVVDRPGFGDSAGPACRSIEEIADRIAEWLDVINVKRPVIYVGHSMGGFIGLMMALRHKQRLKELVLVASFANYRVHPDLLTELRQGRYQADLVRPGFSNSTPIEVFEEFTREMSQLDVTSVLQDFEMIDGCDLTDQLIHIDHSALVLAAREDWITPFRKAAVLTKGLRNSRCEYIENAGHYVLLEKPEEVAAYIISFCEKRTTINPRS